MGTKCHFRVHMGLGMGTKCHFWLHITGKIGNYLAFGGILRDTLFKLSIANLFSSSGGFNFIVALARARVFGKQIKQGFINVVIGGSNFCFLKKTSVC